MAPMSTKLALILGSLTVAPVTCVPGAIVTLAHEPIFQISADGVNVTIVRLKRTLVYQLLALVAVANKPVWAGTIVAGREIGTDGIDVTTMSSLRAFVDFGNARDSIAIESWFTLTRISRIIRTISGFLSNAIGIGRALMVSVSAIVWLVACTRA